MVIPSVSRDRKHEADQTPVSGSHCRSARLSDKRLHLTVFSKQEREHGNAAVFYSMGGSYVVIEPQMLLNHSSIKYMEDNYKPESVLPISHFYVEPNIITILVYLKNL